MSYRFFKYDHDGNITHVRAWIAYLIVGVHGILCLAVIAWAIHDLVRLFS